MIPWWRTEFGESEKAAVCAAIDSRKISQGSITRQFEEALAERLGVPYVVCTTSGTTALTMALMAVGRTTEVIVPDRTWIATAHAVMMTGANVRLADVRADAPILRDITPVLDGCPTDVIVLPVNLNGRKASAHYGRQRVVEDSCQAFPAPPRGDIACYSLSVAKIISTGQGGFCATRSEALYRELLALRTHDVADAMVPAVLEWRRFGYNFRFTDIQAAIGLVQIGKLDERLAKIHLLHAQYRALGVPVLETPTPLYNEILAPSLAEQERLRTHLMTAGIEARPFYPSLHTAPYLGQQDRKFPNADKWSTGLILPSGPCQKLSDIERVADAYHTFA